MEISAKKNTCTIDNLKDYSLGCTVDKEKTVFRLFSPKAHEVTLIIYQNYEDDEGLEFPLEKNEQDIWQTIINDHFYGKWYAYKIDGPKDSRRFMNTKYPVADPWSKHVTTRNHHLQFPKTKIIRQNGFTWEDQAFSTPEDARDLVIYETHIKDLVAHPSAKTFVQGIYNDFREAQRGGIAHLKEMGVNAVEFLPLQKFAYTEPPFNKETDEGVKNTWNAYATNYWGYMTSFHFVPETMYASNGSTEAGALNGVTRKAHTELKQLVNELHKENISVIMDVVYNHASHYDINPLKYTAKDHYFRLDEKGNFLNDSWTGNDINTAAQHSRQLIVESIKYWMQEFHIDGFRFDLAGLIDWETVDLIRDEARKINPNVVLIAEPWGGDYKPDGYSDHDWASWNDHYRNAFKGYNPMENKGIIFSDKDPHLTRFGIENFIRGTLKGSENGLFNHSGHSVNYLESHDGHTLGDYIRLVHNPEKKQQVFEDKMTATKLTEKEEKTALFAAIVLFTSQGITMMHAGQEWARTKVVQDPDNVDPDKGKINRDTYNKDDATNWLNFEESTVNKALYEYYKGLIKLRLKSPALRKAQPQEVNFKVYKDPFHITWSIDGKSSGDMYDYFVSLNANFDQAHDITLPEGYWELVANDRKAGFQTMKSVKNSYKVPPGSGVVLRKLRVNKA
ncbi:alpha-amylase family glycosyl hydrolase [Gracilimonas mengyeensis]|uniref:Pullulanase n=1 Tax=Gracilimonas mengyeensis TaxID=1302730 RepID=A0A521AJ74_9BACT|nr:alpha-amylase family glycosyl hydrolase [Gracilimonas mengyeensis]SMO34884.1 pullulanase [Gracilimonas mengyeensis]